MTFGSTEYTPIWSTTKLRQIAAESPEDYLRQRIDANSMGEEEIRRRLISHAIDYDVLAQGDYDAFLQSRAEAIFPEMRKLGGGMRSDV